MPTNQMVPVVDPNGQLGDLDASDLGAAIQQGYRPATQAELHESSLQQQYGEGGMNAAKAFGASAARTATLGLSDQALTRLNLSSPEALSEREKRFPGVSAAGMVAGVAMPAILGNEAGVASLLTSPMQGVSALGRAAEAMGARALGGIGGKVVGSAVEGAALGLGQSVSEQALGDPELNAQKIAGNVLTGALLGGGLGGVAGAFTEALPGALQTAREAVGKLFGTAEGGELGPLGKAYAKAASVVSSKPEQSIVDVLQNRAKMLVTPEEKEQAATKLAESLQEQYSQVNMAVKEAYDRAKPQEVANLLPEGYSPVVREELGKAQGNLKSVIQDMRAKPELYPANVAAKLEAIDEGMVRDLPGINSNAEAFNRLNELKQTLQDQVKFGKIPTSAEMDAIQAVNKLRAGVKEGLENEDVWGQMGARQAQFNEAYAEHTLAKKDFQRRFMFKTQGKGGGVAYKMDPVKVNTYQNQILDTRGALRSQVLDTYTKSSNRMLDQVEQTFKSVPEETWDRSAVDDIMKKNADYVAKAQEQAQLAAQLKVIGGQSDRLVGAGAGSMIGAGLSMVHPVLGAAAYVAAKAASALKKPALTIQRLATVERWLQKNTARIEGGAKSVLNATTSSLPRRMTVAAFDKVATQVRDLSSSPQKLLDAVHTHTEGLQDHAPEMTQHMQTAAVAGLMYLSTLLPPQAPETPFSKPLPESPAEAAKFGRVYEAVRDPISLLTNAARGTLTADAVQAVQATNPKLLQHIQTEVLNAVTSRKRPMAYQAKTMVSLLLGQPVMPSMTPPAIMANQAAFAPKQPQGPPGGRAVPVSRAQALHGPERMQTPMQAVETRNK